MPAASTPVTPRPSPAVSQAPTIDEDRTLTAGGGASAAMKANRKKNKKLGRLRADMIKRVDVPVRINEMSVSGWLKERRAAAAARGSEGEEDRGDSSSGDEARSGVEMSDFPVTKLGDRPGAKAAADLRKLDVRDDDVDENADKPDQVSILQQPIHSPGSMDGHGFDTTTNPTGGTPTPGVMFSEPSAHARRRFSDSSRSEPEGEAEAHGDEEASESEERRQPRGRSFTLQSRDGGRGLATPPSEREASPAGHADAAGHTRA